LFIYRKDTVMRLSMPHSRQAMYVKCHFEARLCNSRSSGKAIIVKYYEFVCLYSSLRYFTQKQHLLWAVLCCHLEPLCVYSTVPHYLISGTTCHFFNNCLKYFLFQEELGKIRSQMHIGLHIKYPLFLSDFNESRILVTDFRKNLQIPNLIKMHPVGAELFKCGQRA